MGKDTHHRGDAPRRTRFARLDHDILQSAAYRALSCTARALLVEFAMLYNTRNNGELYLSVRDAAARLGLSDMTAASAAMAELMDLGFIDVTADGIFASSGNGQSKARCFRITWEQAPGLSATFDYRAAVVRGNKPAKRAMIGRQALARYATQKNRGEDSNTLPPVSVSDSSTLPRNCADKTPPIVRDSNTPIAQKRLIAVDGHRSGFQHTYSYTTSPAPSERSGTPSEYPSNAGGAQSTVALNHLRGRLKKHLKAAGYGGAKALSKATGIPESVVSRFRSGSSLSEKYDVSLRLFFRMMDEREAA